LADYRDHYAEIRATGAEVVAISVDPPEKSQALRAHLSLPFMILCDTEHRVVSDWGVYNSREKSGIAKPAVFIIGPGRVVRCATVDSVVRRVPAAEIVSLLQSSAKAQPTRRRAYNPRWSDWKTAIRNLIRR
jgi:thioredoxin-dependent peroxiredoxin